MSTAAVAPPSSTGQALAMPTTAMGYLADAGVTQLAAEVLAECLRVLERVDAVEIVARTRVLGAFAAARGYCEDGDYSLRSWREHKTRITRGAAAAHTAWVGRAGAHPRFLAAIGTVLDTLPAPRGAEDDRGQAQRSHDGLQEAVYRLVAAGLLPGRAGPRRVGGAPGRGAGGRG